MTFITVLLVGGLKMAKKNVHRNYAIKQRREKKMKAAGIIGSALCPFCKSRVFVFVENGGNTREDSNLIRFIAHKNRKQKLSHYCLGSESIVPNFVRL